MTYHHYYMDIIIIILAIIMGIILIMALIPDLNVLIKAFLFQNFLEINDNIATNKIIT